MSVLIKSVDKGSIGEKKHLKSGYKLVSINGNKITDVLDYRFYTVDTKVTLEYIDNKEKLKTVKIKKDEYDDIGLEFETYLMDNQRSCRNKCIFCFIDQLPDGMRESLYFKDDDDRLSFLFGNYITLTNVSDEEIDRIIKMHISPINVSVHTTNPELRKKMMNNRFAGDVLRHLKTLSEACISLNCQLVLCPGINDGDELKRSLNDLSDLDSVESIAAVPVGLSDHREGLFELDKYTIETARDTLDIMLDFGNKRVAEGKSRLIYPGDEFFILAKRPFPDEEFYGNFDQLENGVGLIVSQKVDFRNELEDVKSKLDKPRHISLATGVSAAPFIKELVDEAKEKWHNLSCDIYPIINDYFGHNIVVAGLVTATDIIKQLKGKNLGEELIIPDVMLKQDENIFLDDITVEQLEKELNIVVRVTETNGAGLLHGLLGSE